MASLRHSQRVKAAAMVVGVSDIVWSSGYCTWRKPSIVYPFSLQGP
jgi:hypothetical protein